MPRDLDPEAVKAIEGLAKFFGVAGPEGSRPELGAFLESLDTSKAGARQFRDNPIGLIDVTLAALANRKEHAPSNIRDHYGKNIEAVQHALDCLVYFGLAKSRETVKGRRFRIVAPPRQVLAKGLRQIRSEARPLPFEPGALRQLAKPFPATALSLLLELLDPEP